MVNVCLQTEFIDKYPNRINLKVGEFLGLWKIAHQDKLDNGNRVELFLSGLPVTEWSDNINFRLFAGIATAGFFKHLINSIILQTSIMAMGRCEMYFVITPPLYIVSSHLETKYILQ